MKPSKQKSVVSVRPKKTKQDKDVSANQITDKSADKREVDARFRRGALTPKKQRAFLRALNSGLTVRDAAKEIGITSVSLYALRKRDEDFALAWEEAYEQGTDILEKEAERRAVKGVKEGIYHQGKRIATVRKYSDVLLIFLLKGRRPRKFRDNVDITSGGESMNTALKQFADVIRTGAARLKDE